MKKTLLILFAIVLLGGFLRFYKLGELSFVADEFLDINSSYAYSQTGVWQSWDFNRGQVNVENEFAPRDQRAWLYKIQVAQLFKYLAPTEQVARSVSAMWGIFTIVLMYLVAKSLTQKKTIGLLSAFLFAVSVSGIYFDRRLRMYAMFFPLFLLFSWLTYKFYEGRYKGKHKWCKKISDNFSMNLMYLAPAVAVGILSLMVHDLTVTLAAIFFVYVAIQAGRLAFGKKNFVNKYSLSLGLILLGGISVIILAGDKVGKYTAGIKFFNDNYSYFNLVLSDYSHQALALIVLFSGLIYLFKKKLTKEAIWLGTSFMVPFLMAMFLWRRNAGPQYIFFAQSFQVIIMAAGIYGIAKFFKKNLSSINPKKTFAVSILLAVILVPNWAYFLQENNVYNQTSEAENPNYRSVFTYFKKKKNSKDVLITRNFRNYYWSGQNVKVYDFGGELAEEKYSLAQLMEVVNGNKSGWVIYSDNDERYLANDAVKYIEENMTKVNDVAVRGNIFVYRWGR